MRTRKSDPFPPPDIGDGYITELSKDDFADLRRKVQEAMRSTSERDGAKDERISA